MNWKGVIEMSSHFQEYYLSQRLSGEPALLYCGYERCAPTHRWGPSMRDHVVLHYIRSGSGVFRAGGEQFRLKEGDSFCLFPRTPHVYYPDEQTPWAYYWLAFDGEQAERLLKLCGITDRIPVHSHAEPVRAERYFGQLLEAARRGDLASELAAKGIALQLLSTYMDRSRGVAQPLSAAPGGLGRAYVEQAVGFMEEHYEDKLTISAIAGHVGLERAYFTKLFHAQLGVSPHEFLFHIRMRKAVLMLSHTDKSVGEVASGVGFADAAYFSKAFARFTGLPPSRYRQRDATGSAQNAD